MRLVTILLAVLLGNSLQAAVYNIDATHTGVGFKIKHLVVATVNGRFNKFEGTFDFDEKTGKLENVSAKIDLESIDTNEKKRDDHLRGADFFNVKKNRHMTFTGKKVEMDGTKPVKVIGDLTLNGVTKEVPLAVTYHGATKDPWGNDRVAFEATTKLNRKDFNMAWNKALETGGLLVGDELTVLIEGEAVKKK